MSNVLRFRPRGRHAEAVREEACLWIVRLSEGADAQLLATLHQWLDEDPGHLPALVQAAGAWDRSAVLAALSDVFPLDDYLPRTTPRTRSQRWVSHVAAALLLVFAGCLGALGLRGWIGQGAPESVQLSYETRIGQQSTIVLSDGSVVILNTNSRIEINFSKAWRDIVLVRGEAHFTVMKNSRRPFRVHANGGVVEAVGTAFTVQERQLGGLEVTVVEGVVNFTPTQPVEAEHTQGTPAAPAAAPLAVQPIALSAGESVQTDESSAAIVKQKFEPAEIETKLAWRDGMLLFEGDSFESVVREVSRYTLVQFDVDEAIRNIQVLGYFQAGDIEGFLDVMSDTFNIEVERLDKNHIALRAKNP